MQIDLSIIIVNWKSREFLNKCISSIYLNTREVSFEIIVIDSGSFDGCDEMLRLVYPQVRFIQSDRNLGFAKANNQAFLVSNGLNILFLNPDTEIESNAVHKLMRKLESIPSAGAVGAKLLNSDRSVQETCIRAFPTILNQALDSDMLRKLCPMASLWGMKPLFAGDEGAKIVEAVSGACLMIKRSVFRKVGMFSTDYFMYSEDIDLCLKVRMIGLNTYYVPTAVIVHHGGGSSLQASTNTFSSVMMLESRWRYFRKTRSLWYSRFYRFAMFGTSIARIGLAVFVWPFQGLRGRESVIENALKKWMASLRWTLGGERWVKNN